MHYAFSPLQLLVNMADTVKLFPENLVTYKLLGEPDGPHYAHYDLVGGRLVSCIYRSPMLELCSVTYYVRACLLSKVNFSDNLSLQAVEQVYPCITEFLSHHDSA